MPDFDPKVAHLLRRATLGPTMEEVADASQRGLQATLDSMLSQLDRPLTRAELTAQAIGPVFLKDHQSLRAGWMLRMVSNSNLLREKLTLFWHNHFATAIAKVRGPALMAQQIETLRELGLGDFKAMLLAIARDPAMQIWLDNNLNVAGKPNENFARELMELFTLGIGHYTEKDVQEVARAFTGWNMDQEGPRGRRFTFFPDKHDTGIKTVLGKSGNLDGTDVIDLLADHPQTPQFVCRKLWQFFVHQAPTDADLAPMVQAYTSSGRQIAPTLKAMFLSPGFFSPQAVGTQVKSPIEYVVGVVRSLRADVSEIQQYATAAAAMGMDLYNPPDVAGWKGGEEWISTYTLLERIRFVRALVAKGKSGKVAGLDTDQIIRENFIANNTELVDHFLIRFMHRIPEGQLRPTLLSFLSAGTRAPNVVRLPPAEKDEKIRGLIRLILVSPEYQLC
ncbi:MAG TPA: DUF1800 domain-containing protein [Tepidisphaeraceae bacterium]|nr:DUF1800 domain-containing protein [Tepidisphaeraceae bacterium]